MEDLANRDVLCLGFGVWGLGFRIVGLGLWIWVLRLRGVPLDKKSLHSCTFIILQNAPLHSDSHPTQLDADLVGGNGGNS